MSSDPKLELEPKEEQSSPDSSKPQSKKKRGPPTANRRRTKTGCLSYQAAATRSPAHLEQFPPPSNYFTPLHQQHMAALQQIPRRGSLTPGSTLGSEHPTYFTYDAATINRSHGEPVYEVAFGTDQQQLTPAHELGTPLIGPYPDQWYSCYAVGSEMHTTTYSPYPEPGRQPQMPPSIDAPGSQDHIVSQLPSSLSFGGNNSATNTDSQKSSSREGQAQKATAILPQPSLATNSEPGPSHRPNFIPTARHFQHAFDAYEDPDDPWDVEDDDYDNHDALIASTTCQNLILDERMAYLLKHFVTILRPCISVHEKSVTFDGSSTFAEILPTRALSSRGLLHGILATSALHLAVLHRTSDVVPLKHFVIASRKMAQLISNPSSRHQLETLGLCLLLAFYEVLLGDHARWVLHLRGAAALMMEHDFAAFIRATRERRAQARALSAQPQSNRQGILLEDWFRMSDLPSALASDEEWDVDDALIRKLTGLEIDYSCQLQNQAKTVATTEHLTQQEALDWRTKIDLFWWYAKMDIFQSILSGDRLLLPYENWRYVPPRGQLGSVEQLHATMDHLWLVLGRIADFAAKDRARKLRKIAANGGIWKPEPGFLAGQKMPPESRSESQSSGSTTMDSKNTKPPGANEGRARMPKNTGDAAASKRGPPLFFGMMPPPKIPPSMLSSFHIADAALCGAADRSPPVSSTMQDADLDLESTTKAAIAEHNAISEALEVWRTALGEAFQGRDVQTKITRAPFLTVKQYSDFRIAHIWSFYYLGRILLRRCHPYSPPAMMVSAGVNAAFTAADANAIGQINAGVLESQAEYARIGSINPTLVAVVQELTFPIMFAGVQYREPALRSWTIESLLDVAKHSGWRSSHSVAFALETAWANQGEYTRTLARRDAHEPSNANLASNDLGATPEALHESRFVKHDRRLIDRFSDTRAYWAMGLLSSQDDLQKIMGHLEISRD
ncbi:hypothetical protein LTR05_007680 [Lithohypha guttulata]|uniref:Uncharacterized protein n=1 Tax=Lithohypha guttulata TaxID=1690604 RepID=A0AAN7SU10_9EURO|nr:hypothetical protein LTR05_007680 [Lithohypha guttulata]